MLYHVKFGDFGTMEGQFTEPTGVCCNAQNELIVTDANSHRAQVFDAEGRFKFSLGSQRQHHNQYRTTAMAMTTPSSQLVYPNRAAVCLRTGDIVISERPPSHQIKVYDQYGVYLRRFGAEQLRNPKGICVDSAGRVLIIECKVLNT